MIVFASNRPGSQGFDIWSASRSGPHGVWAEPVNAGVFVLFLLEPDPASNHGIAQAGGERLAAVAVLHRKEALALVHKVEALVKEPGDLPLLKDLAAELKHNNEAAKDAPPPPSKHQDPDVEKARILASLHSMSVAVDAKASPQAAAQLKQWLAA